MLWTSTPRNKEQTSLGSLIGNGLNFPWLPSLRWIDKIPTHFYQVTEIGTRSFTYSECRKMPELPEVEYVCNLIRTVLEGKTLTEVQAFPDSIVYKRQESSVVAAEIQGETLRKVGRKGKFFWLSFSEDLNLIGHLGMSGWAERTGGAHDPPKYSKLILKTFEDGIALTDPRRLGRLWLSADPANDPTIKRLGFDAYENLPKNPRFHALFKARKAPIKAILLDQSVLSGLGNYLVDEILYQAKIAPQRPASELTPSQISKLRASIVSILKLAVAADSDETKYPSNWLFHKRWGGKKGPDTIDGRPIVRDTVGGRTTAWVPSVQS
jgi:formamidopyrimidine-DNA glycosylase